MRTVVILPLIWSAIMKKLLPVFVLALFFASTCYAEMTVVTIDVNRVMNQAEDSQKKIAALDKRSKAAKEKIESKRDSLKKTEAKLKAGKISSDSSEADKFRQEAKDFARWVKDTEEELKRDFLKSNKELTEKVLKVVSNYAREKDIDLVLEKSASARGPVLFGSASSDITEEIIKLINK
jgi:Skp family chaperone for outer membrane proteins